jgi:hypothetical protein
MKPTPLKGSSNRNLQKTLSSLLEQKKGRAREFGENLKMLFGMALNLWEEYRAGAVTDFEARAAELRFVISYQLRERARRDSDNRHLLKVLRRYHQRGGLLHFLKSLWWSLPTTGWSGPYGQQ